MRNLKFISLLVFTGAWFGSGHVYTQGDANAVLRAVSTKLQKANDYSVEANIRVDMPLIRILPVDVKIYFRQPDLIKVESKSIAVVPRQGFGQMGPLFADTNSYTALILGMEKTGDTETSIVNVIPLTDTSDMIFGKFWIDPVRSVIVKSQITTRSSGTIVTEYTYGTQEAYGLPDAMTFTVDVTRFKLPKGLTNGTDKGDRKEDIAEKENKKGRIYITLSNYQVNKGIPDGVFRKK